MRICYVDEAGCTGSLPSATSDIQPVLVIAGIDLPERSIAAVTHDFLCLKKEFFPGLASSESLYLDWILAEVKGADLRRKAATGSRRRRRGAIGFLDKVLSLLETHGARLHGRVWVKEIGGTMDGRAVYTSSLQYIYRCFEHSLEQDGDRGVVICDSRNKELNLPVSYSIFTQKFKTGGDAYPRILEMPTFGHSENHAGVQLADLICSAFLFPMAIEAYCRGSVRSVHIRSYRELRVRFGPRLEILQPRFMEPFRRRARSTGGVIVDDRINRRSRSEMFRAPMPKPVTGDP